MWEFLLAPLQPKKRQNAADFNNQNTLKSVRFVECAERSEVYTWLRGV